MTSGCSRPERVGLSPEKFCKGTVGTCACHGNDLVNSAGTLSLRVALLHKTGNRRERAQSGKGLTRAG